VYPLLFGVQTIGVVLLYAHILPLFKQLVVDPTTHEKRIETRVWLISTIALIQAGYWLRYRLRPPLPSFVNAFVGHLVVFAGRLAFTLATAVFSFVFLLHKLASQLPLVGYLLTVAGVFSLFCYMQELQRLGERMMGRGENVNQVAR
jgi:drug/metabolite transporter (DMT)-like permease